MLQLSIKSLLALTVFFTLSCQNKSNSANPRTPNFLAEVQKLKVICHDEETCSPSVGNFMVMTAEWQPEKQKFNIQFGNCTASLIAPNLAITNRHCFIDTKAKAGDSCENIFIKFPKVGTHQEEIAECKEVVFRPQVDPMDDDQKTQNLDVAIIKLKSSSKRPTLKVSTEGFKNNEMVTIHRVTTQELKTSDNQSEIRSYLEALHCPVVQDAAIKTSMRLASHPFSAFVYMANCPIVESNSGSPILDSQSSIKAVVNSYISAEIIKRSLPAAEKFKDGTQGINLACVDSPVINPNGITHPECKQTLDFNEQKVWASTRLNELHINRMALLKELHPDFYQKAMAAVGTPTNFTWVYKPIKDKNESVFDIFKSHNKFWFLPECVRSQKDAEDFYQSLQSIPIFIDQTTFDENGRLQEKIEIQIVTIEKVETKSDSDKVSLKIVYMDAKSNLEIIQDTPICKR